jgi:hypothetical protein
VRERGVRGTLSVTCIGVDGWLAGDTKAGCCPASKGVVTGAGCAPPGPAAATSSCCQCRCVGGPCALPLPGTQQRRQGVQRGASQDRASEGRGRVRCCSEGNDSADTATERSRPGSLRRVVLAVLQLPGRLASSTTNLLPAITARVAPWRCTAKAPPYWLLPRRCPTQVSLTSRARSSATSAMQPGAGW